MAYGYVEVAVNGSINHQHATIVIMIQPRLQTTIITETLLVKV